MYLGDDQTLFQDFTVQHLNIHIVNSLLFQSLLWQSINDGRFQRLYLKLRRFLSEETLYAHENRSVNTQVLSHFLVILKIELTDQAPPDIIDGFAYLSLMNDHISLGKLHRNQDTLQGGQFVVSHRTVLSRKFPSDVSCGYS